VIQNSRQLVWLDDLDLLSLGLPGPDPGGDVSGQDPVIYGEVEQALGELQGLIALPRARWSVSGRDDRVLVIRETEVDPSRGSMFFRQTVAHFDRVVGSSSTSEPNRA
jgi:hypothetical protein